MKPFKPLTGLTFGALLLFLGSLDCKAWSEDANEALKDPRQIRSLLKRAQLHDYHSSIRAPHRQGRQAPGSPGIFTGLNLKGFDKDDDENAVETSLLEKGAKKPSGPVDLLMDNDHKEVEHPELAQNADQKTTNEVLNQQTAFGGQGSSDPGSDDPGPTLFTVANTDTERPWEQIPYREKFQWSIMDAPCHTFLLAVPDERDAHGEISLCIYRRNLEYTEHSAMIIHKQDRHVDIHEQREMKVYGHVVDHPGSAVYGRLVQRYFYGEVSMIDSVTNQALVYVVEEIKLLSSLMHHSEKLIHNLMVVMNNGMISGNNGRSNTGKPASPSPSTAADKKYNAVVTIGVSLLSFVSTSFNMNQFKPTPFVVLSTGHNSYITSGEPVMQIDDNGRVKLTSPGDVITIEVDGSIMLNTKSKQYTFRPRGKTILREGLKVTTLQEHEGPVAMTAVTSSLNYGCIVPSPSFTDSRRGGFLCKVCLAADQTFEEKYNQTDNETTGVFLGHIIDKVSWIFRSVDWDMDNKFDNIGLDYDLQVFNWKYTDDEKEDQTPEELEVLFNTLTSIDFSECCLGVAFTMKKFPPNTFAKSSPSKPMTPAGICAVRTEEVSNNVILISGNDKSGGFSALSPSRLVYLTAHEIAKAFGAMPDTTGETNCDSFTDGAGQTRHFLLWPDVLRETTLEEKSFSPCSRQSIQKALGTCKSSCFDLDQHPFCGNGIVEEGEECDCGSEQACSDQFCCYGRSGKFPCRKTGVPCKRDSGGMFFSASTSLVLSLASLAVGRNLRIQALD